MPNFIELDKNPIIPTSSAESKFLFGLDVFGNPILVDNTGSIIPIGGNTGIFVPNDTFNPYTSSNDSKVDALLNSTSSYIKNNQTSSMIVSGSINSLSASYIKANNIDGNIISSSYSLTSSYAQIANTLYANKNYSITSLNVSTIDLDGGNIINLGNITSSTINISTGNINILPISGGGGNIIANNITASFLTGSLTGSLLGTASWSSNSLSASYVTGNAVSSSYALTASYIEYGINVNYASTASYVENAVSSSYSLTSSYVAGNVASSSYSDNTLSSSYSLTSSYVAGNVASSSYSLTSSYVAGSVASSSYSDNTLSSSYSLTASYANNSISSSYLSGSNAIINNLTIVGQLNASQISGSQIYITSSQLTVTDNILTLNAQSPHLKYAGIEMYDSGSSQNLASFLWDGTNNYFFLSSSDSNFSRKLITGPDNEGNLTNKIIPLATSSNGLIDSIIYQETGKIGIGISNPLNTLSVAGTISASIYTASLNQLGFYGTSSWAQTSSVSINSQSASYASNVSTVVASAIRLVIGAQRSNATLFYFNAFTRTSDASSSPGADSAFLLNGSGTNVNLYLRQNGVVAQTSSIRLLRSVDGTLFSSAAQIGIGITSSNVQDTVSTYTFSNVTLNQFDTLFVECKPSTGGSTYTGIITIT